METELIHSRSLPELALLKRPELSPTYSKINLFKLTQFNKILYLDSDTLPIHDLTHLFTQYPSITEDEIVAAPDSGWPDIFNSGLFLIKPSVSTFQKLLSKIHFTESPSFDGADQGLLNEYFTVDSPESRKWIKLPFIYNVTPSGQYQYEPAYQFFRDKIKLIHFIGAQKPWDSGRDGERYRWWDKYTEFFGHASVKETVHGIKPRFYIPPPAPEPASEPIETYEEPQVSHVEQNHDAENKEAYESLSNPQTFQIFETIQPDSDHWDPSRDEPPQDGKPEAASFPDLGHYYNEWDRPQEVYEHAEEVNEPHEVYIEDNGALEYDEHPNVEEEWTAPPIFPWEFEEERNKPERVFANTETEEFSFDNPWENLPIFQRIKHKSKEISELAAQERAKQLASEEENEELERRSKEVERITYEFPKKISITDPEPTSSGVVPPPSSSQPTEASVPEDEEPLFEEPEISTEDIPVYPKPETLEQLIKDEEVDEQTELEEEQLELYEEGENNSKAI